MTLAEFRTKAIEFLGALESAMSERSIVLVPNWSVDHLCYRTESMASYERLRGEISCFARLVTESPVNGRPIATFLLETPIRLHERWIDILELPAPKPGKLVREGFEHIEVVIDCPFSEIESRFRDCQWDRSGCAKALNPELEIELGSLAVKFHHLSLESVVRLESNTRVFYALEKSRALHVLHEFTPLVAGTFPLGLETSESDVDVLVGGNLDLIEDTVRTAFQAQSGFDCRRTEKNSLPTLVARFTVDGVPLEIFAQEQASVRQVAYRHFQIEERLLRLGRPALLEKVRSLRQDGTKTEPAFTRALWIEGDPFAALLKLDSCDEKELIELLAKSGFARDSI